MSENLGRQTLFRRPDNVHHPLYVITPIFNSARFRSRWKLYENFAKHIEDSGAILYTVEVSFGNRDFSVTNSNNPKHIQLTTREEIWLKENMINIGISRLPSDWKYVAWIDGDIQFSRNDWVGETIQKLQHYHIIQMFSHAVDLSPNFEPILNHEGFVYCYLNNIPNTPNTPTYYYNQISSSKKITWHTGWAWAARRSAINYLGGLIDFAPLGAADHHMARCLIGQAKESIHPAMHKEYIEKVLDWQYKAEKYIKRNIGYMDGLILHYWHGKKADRKYWDRWKILTNNQFRPSIHLKRDWQNLWQLEGDNIKLRDQIRAYFFQRNEDSIDL